MERRWASLQEKLQAMFPQRAWACGPVMAGDDKTYLLRALLRELDISSTADLAVEGLLDELAEYGLCCKEDGVRNLSTEDEEQALPFWEDILWKIEVLRSTDCKSTASDSTFDSIQELLEVDPEVPEELEGRPCDSVERETLCEAAVVMEMGGQEEGCDGGCKEESKVVAVDVHKERSTQDLPDKEVMERLLERCNTMCAQLEAEGHVHAPSNTMEEEAEVWGSLSNALERFFKVQATLQSMVAHLRELQVVPPGHSEVDDLVASCGEMMGQLNNQEANV